LVRGGALPPQRGTNQKPPQGASRHRVTSGLNEDVEHDPVLIDGTPEIVPHAVDREGIPRPSAIVSRRWPAAAHAVGETRNEILAPAPHRLVGGDSTASSQKQLDIT